MRNVPFGESFFVRISLLLPTLFFGMAIPNLQAAADTCNWSGAVNGNWSNGGNWTGCDNGGVPQNGDQLQFPSGAANLSNSNDISNLSIVNISINGTGYTLSGNALTVNGGITMNAGGNTLNLPLTASPPSNILTGISSSNGDNTINSTVTLNMSGNYEFTASGGTLRFSQVVSGNANILFIGSPFGDGILEMAAENTFAATINFTNLNLNSITVRCLASACFGASANFLFMGFNGANAAIELAASSISVPNSLSIDKENPAGSLRTADDITSAAWSGNISVNNSTTFVTGTNATLSIDGGLGFGSGTLTYEGVSEIVQNGEISSSGGSIVSQVPLLTLPGLCNSSNPVQIVAEAGVVAIDTLDYDACPFTVSGGTVTGNGKIGAVTGNSGFFSSGAPTGQLTVNGAFSLSSNLTFSEEIGGTSAGLDYDQTVVTGNADLGDATLEIALVNGFTPAIGDSFTILRVNGDIAGTFAGLPDGTIFDAGGVPLRIDYNLGSGEDTVVLTVIGASPAVENCANGTDDDGDADVDCQDADCALDPACAPPGSEICDNGTDDDEDSFVDCDDLDCAANPICAAPGLENCANASDDDGDGQIDCQDSDCASAQACQGRVQGGGCSLSSFKGSSLSWTALLIPIFLLATARNLRRKEVF